MYDITIYARSQKLDRKYNIVKFWQNIVTVSTFSMTIPSCLLNIIIPDHSVLVIVPCTAGEETPLITSQVDGGVTAQVDRHTSTAREGPGTQTTHSHHCRPQSRLH